MATGKSTVAIFVVIVVLGVFVLGCNHSNAVGEWDIFSIAAPAASPSPPTMSAREAFDKDELSQIVDEVKSTASFTVTTGTASFILDGKANVDIINNKGVPVSASLDCGKQTLLFHGSEKIPFGHSVVFKIYRGSLTAVTSTGSALRLVFNGKGTVDVSGEGSVFIEGETITVSGSAIFKATDCPRIRAATANSPRNFSALRCDEVQAFGTTKAYVEACKVVTAYASASLYAENCIEVTATDFARVFAKKCTGVGAYEDSKLFAEECSYISGYHRATIQQTRCGKVKLHDKAKVVPKLY